MGCVNSKKGSVDITEEGGQGGGGGCGIGRPLPRDKYYDNHPNSHNKPKNGNKPAILPAAQGKQRMLHFILTLYWQLSVEPDMILANRASMSYKLLKYFL